MRRPRRLLALLVPALLAGSPGCRPPVKPCPIPEDLRTVAVLPFVSRAPIGREAVEEFSDIFASEWVKTAGVRVVRPAAIAPSIGPGRQTLSLEEAVRLARGVKADAFVTAAVTDYDPYEPPRIGLSVQFLRTSAQSLSGPEVDRLVQSASWRCGPLPLGREAAGHWIAAFERVYDAHDRRVRSELCAYAGGHEAGDTPFGREREFLAVQPRYMQFVSNQIIREILRSSRDDEP